MVNLSMIPNMSLNKYQIKAKSTTVSLHIIYDKMLSSYVENDSIFIIGIPLIGLYMRNIYKLL